MLAFAAIGSLVISKHIRSVGALRLILISIAFLTVIYIVALPRLFSAWMHWPDPARIVVSMLIIAPLATLMGIPFPVGLRQLSTQAPGLVVWAWGMNGVFSVLGSVLVIIISMSSTFTIAMLWGVAGYSVAALVGKALWQIAVCDETVAAPIKLSTTSIQTPLS
jgi:hypothetical protein